MNVGIIDLGFGDSGKGLVTRAYALKMNNPKIVRFSGGPQAGHNVWIEEKNHIFSNFGCGTLDGIPTYWSQFCTFYPTTFMVEYYDIMTNFSDVSPIFSIHPDAPVTTPFDVIINKLTSRGKFNTVGLGVGETWEREENHYHLHVKDLVYPYVLDTKLQMIYDYYKAHYPEHSDSLDNESFAIQDFKDSIRSALSIITIDDFLDDKYQDLIFEGSQGLLLDQKIGFFPYVTRSNTGSTNILKLVDEFQPVLVTRAYQTRHGAGPLSNTHLGFELNENYKELNVENLQQGAFRTSVLDLDLLDYGLSSDKYLNLRRKRSTIAVTCLDHIDSFKATCYNGTITNHTKYGFAKGIQKYLGIKDLYVSDSKFSENLRKYID